jgi:lipopolysaccharide/colanic/teichoic acid biosynthesis glycosyltransferase
VKRLFDIVGASILLVLSSSLMVGIALAIWLTTGYPILFSQWRKGYQGKAFRIWKFRTMTVADQNCSITDLAWHRQDSRITPIGRTLRRTHLDELPQLWNVLVGDMSLVGPRPVVPSIAQEMEERFPWAAGRSLVKPGLTGPVQVFGRQAIRNDPERCCRLDIEYATIDSEWRRFFQDIRILWATIFVVLSAQGI